MKYLKFIIPIFLIGAIAAYLQYNKPHKYINKTSSDIKIGAAALFAEYSADETAADSKYLDKIVEVKGIVKEVSPDDEGNISITLDSGDELFGVICQLDNLSEQKKVDFQAGEEVSFKGVCTGMLMDVLLVRCVSL